MGYSDYDTAEQAEPLQVHLPRPCTVADLFKAEVPSDATEGSRAEAEATLTEMEEYLSHFCAPTVVDGKRVCHKCGGEFNGLLSMLGASKHVAFEWGLAHGEGHCSGCGWPMRAFHRPKGKDGEELFSLMNLPLAYLPDEVITNREE